MMENKKSLRGSIGFRGDLYEFRKGYAFSLKMLDV